MKIFSLKDVYSSSKKKFDGYDTAIEPNEDVDVNWTEDFVYLSNSFDYIVLLLFFLKGGWRRNPG